MTPSKTQPPPARGRRPRREQVLLLAVAAVTLPVIVWAGVRIADRGGKLASVSDEVPGLSHVHGLGINPADGSLIVATHFGAFRLAADAATATRIGGSFQDTMGFTVAGPNHFLGSGHPDLAGSKAGQPSRLGLIESKDSGKTWKSLSLSGEADFHAMVFAHDRVYGWDSSTGRFMVSTDQRRWETRSTTAIFGFAVDPADAQHVVAAGPAGLTESTDGGRTWTPFDGPPLLTLSWNTQTGLWGAGPDGAVWRRTDGAWIKAGDLGGEPQAFLATPDGLYAAAYAEDTTVVLRSDENGRTWHVRYRDK